MLRLFAFNTRRWTAAKRPTAALLAGLLTLGLCSPAVASLAQSQTFASWTPFANGADVTLTADTTTKHSGAQSLKLVNATATSPNNGGFYQVVPVQPSTLYHITAWVKGTNIASAATDCFGIDQNYATFKCLPAGTFDWQQISWNYTTPAGETGMAFALYSANTGTAWFDDISVVQDDVTTNLVANPGFENSADSITILSPNTSVFSSGGAYLQVTSTAPSISWTAADINHVNVGSGTVNTAGRPNYLALPNVGPGWYSLHLTTSTNSTADSTFTVVANSYIYNSAHPNPFGVNIHPYTAAPGEVAAVGDAGLASVRIDLRWDQTETSPGVYTWDPAEDAIIGNLLGGGVKPLMTMGYSNPLYDNGLTPSSEAGIAAYAAWAAAAAQHFGNRVDYDVYNEYNVAGPSDSACGQTPDCYYALLVPTANAIHNAAPGARVVGPTLGGFTQDWIGSNPDSYNWLKRFLDLGGLSYVDVIAIHNYTFPVITPPEGNNNAVIAAVRTLLGNYPGALAKPLWLTETGFPTYSGFYTDVQQAQTIVRDAALSLRAGISQYMFYDMLDDCADATNGQCRFGLMHGTAETAGTLAPKPGYTAYALLARNLAGFSYASSDSWGTGIYSLLFSTASGTQRRIAWAPAGNSTLAVQSTAPVTVTNWDGQSNTINPTNGVVTFSVGPDAVYIDGTGITSGTIATAPAFSATPPASAQQGQPVSIAISVNGAAPGAPTGSIIFRSAYGSTAVTAAAGSTVNGTLQLSAFPTAGQVTVPIEIDQGSTVVGRLVVSLTVTN